MRIENAMEKVILKKEEAITLRDAYDIISDIYDNTENDELSEVTCDIKDRLETLLFSYNEDYRVFYEEPEAKEKILQISIDIE